MALAAARLAEGWMCGSEAAGRPRDNREDTWLSKTELSTCLCEQSSGCAVFLSRSRRLGHLRGARRCLWTGRAASARSRHGLDMKAPARAFFRATQATSPIPRVNPAPNAAGGLRILPAALPSGLFRRARRHPSTTRNRPAARRRRRDDALA
jgi:hypothetical protein